MPSVDVDRAEDDSPGIEPRDWHLRRLAAQPHAVQRREEQEVRFVLEQLDATRWQLADFPADLPFFSRARDPGRVRTGVASKRNPRHATACGSNSPRGEPRTRVPGVPQAREPSIQPPGNRMAPDDGPYWREGRPEAPHPRPRGDFPRGGLPRRWDPEFAESDRSNDRRSLDWSAGVERSLRSNARCRLRGSQGHGETNPHLERFVTRARACGAGMLSSAACSWDTSVIRGYHNPRRVLTFNW